MSRRKRTTAEGRLYRKRSSPEKGAPDQPILALLKVDEDGTVSDEEISRFMRELGLPETKD